MAIDNDITKTGPKPLKGIRNSDLYPTSTLGLSQIQLNSIDELAQQAAYRNAQAASGHLGYSSFDNPGLFQVQTDDNLEYGSSMFDEGILINPTQETIANQRGDNQPWYAQIAAGISKGLILAGTTFLDGTIGLLTGAITAAAEGRFSGIWDNSFSKAMKEVTDWSEKALPNYYTQEELEAPWWDNIFTANFLGDKFIKNLGFSVGAFYSGNVYAAPFRMGKVAQAINSVFKTTKAAPLTSSMVGVGLASLNEGRVEAINNSTDWFNLHKQQLDDWWDTQINEEFAPLYEEAQKEFAATKGQLQQVTTADGTTRIIDPAAERYKAKLAQLDTQMANRRAAKNSDKRYQEAIGKLSEDRLKMGNMDLLLNLPVLMASNTIQFAKAFAGGYKTGRAVGGIKQRSLNAAEKNAARGAIAEGAAAKEAGATVTATEGASAAKAVTTAEGAAATESAALNTAAPVTAGTAAKAAATETAETAVKPGVNWMYEYAQSRLSTPGAIMKSGLSEGTEEIMQKAASVVSGKYYETNINNWYKKQIDPNAEEETLDFMKANAAGIAETFGDASSWEEFFIGGLTGILGIPTITTRTNAEGKTRLGFKIQGGAYNMWREAQENRARGEELATQMNARIHSPEFLNYYQGLIRHNALQRDMDDAVEKGDPFEFKNAEHAQFVSDIIMFDKAGRLNDLEAILDTALDTSEENLAEIVKQTTSKTADGKLAGPYAEYAHLEDDNSLSVDFGKEGIAEMTKKVNKQREESLAAIKAYKKTKNDLDIAYGAALDDDQLAELTYMSTQLQDWQSRAKDMAPLIRKTFQSMLDGFTAKQRQYDEKVTASRKEQTESIDESLDEALASTIKEFKQVDRTKKYYDNIRDLLSKSDEELVGILMNPENKEFLESTLTNTLMFAEDYISGLDILDAVQMIGDLPKIGEGIKNYQSKLAEYIVNPNKITEDKAKATEEVAKEVSDKKASDLKGRLSAAKNISELRDIIKGEEESGNIDAIIKELEEEGSTVAKNYRETQMYDNEIQKALVGLGEDAQIVQDAKVLWEAQKNAAENITQIANPNSVFINNDTAFDEASGGDVEMSSTRFQNARYAIQKAISKVNNDIKFRDRFSPEYKQTPAKNEGKSEKPGTEEKQESQEEQASQNTQEPASISQIPVGNESAKEIAAANKEVNKAAQSPADLNNQQQGKRKYYNPTIPELHIEASKEGDFRPFDVVVAEREHGANYHVIYEYLRDNGAFDYVNSGKLKVGDTLKFMIDPEFEESMKASLGDKYKGPTIFFVTSDGQIVGDVASSTAARYEGLQEAVNKIKEEFNQYSQKASNTSINSFEDIAHVTTTHDGYRNVTNLQDWSKAHTSDVRQENKKEGWYEKNGILYYYRPINGRAGDNTTLWVNSSLSEESKEKIQKLFSEATSVTEELKQQILDVIKSDNSARKNSNNKFVASPETKVSQIMVGKIPYTSEERNLADIPGVSDENRQPIFGIAKQGIIHTNGKVSQDKIVTPADLASKDGRLYLLIPNAAGTYSPVAVRVKHLNRQEFDLNDTTVANSLMGKEINLLIEKLSRATTKEEVSSTIEALAKEVFMGDVIVSHFDKAGGGILFSRKVRRADGTYEMVTIDGKEVPKTIKTPIYFYNAPTDITVNGIHYTSLTAAESVGIDVTPYMERKSDEAVQSAIREVLFSYNLPLQVDANSINSTGYNNRLIKSGILTSNLREAKVIGSWFTTDYFDAEGNLKEAIKVPSIPRVPAASKSPVGGTNSVIPGIAIRGVNHPTRYVNLTNNTILDENGNDVTTSMSAAEKQLYFDMAWALNAFGDATVSPSMINNIVVTPEGRVLNRTTGKYLTGEAAQKVKDDIAKRNKQVADSEQVLQDIEANQIKVDKGRTDSEYYYVQEEDGEYHPYSRVHSVLGDNWAGSREGTDSNNALKAGSMVDIIIRDYFNNKVPTRPEGMSEEAFNNLLDRLNQVKSSIEARGERFLTNNIVLYKKYADGTRVAGEVDILAIDKDGNFKIYDVKTSKYSFGGTYFNTKGDKQRMSTKDYYTLQLSAYQNLFESQYGVPIVSLGILPFVLTYDGSNVVNIVGEKGIPITYNANVGIRNTYRTPEIKPPTTVIDEATEDYRQILSGMNPTIDTSEDQAFADDLEASEDYYVIDGKLHKGYVSMVGEVAGITVGMLKIPQYTRGFNKNGPLRIAFYDLYAVFPNGKAIRLGQPQGDVEYEETRNTVKDVLSKNPNRVVNESAEDTIIIGAMQQAEANRLKNQAALNGGTPLEESTTPITPNTPITPSNSGAAAAVNIAERVAEKDDEFEDDTNIDDLLNAEDSPSVMSYNKQRAILSNLPLSYASKDRGRIKAYLRLGRSLQEIQDITGLDVVKRAGYFGVLWDSLTEEQRREIARNYSEERTVFNAEYAKKGYSIDTLYSVEEIEPLIVQDLYKSPLFKKILELAKQFGITVQFTNRYSSDTALGFYGKGNVSIRVSPNDPRFERVIMHELIHSVTMGILYRKGTGELTKEQESAVKMLEEVYESVKGTYEGSWYGMTSLEEFVAELANPAFREFLRGKRIDEKTSLWDKVKNFFKRIFGNKLEVSDAALERMLNNPLKDDGAKIQYLKELKRGVQVGEVSYIQDYLSTLDEEERSAGHFIVIHNNRAYEIDTAPSLHSHLDNLDGRHYGFHTERVITLLKEDQLELNKVLNTSYVTKDAAKRAINAVRIGNNFTYKLIENNKGNFRIQLLRYTENRRYTFDDFDSLDPEIQTNIFDSGMTKEQYNRLSKEEKDWAIHCAAL